MSDLSRRRGPIFLGLGPERTGTSWLYAHLRRHPDVFLCPVKELRYFYEKSAYGFEPWGHRLLAVGDWHNKDYRNYLGERLARLVRQPGSMLREWERIKWDCRYVFSVHDEAWYLSLFDSQGERAGGDISPQYFSLPDIDIAQIAALIPDAKIIIGMRDPIEWSWSFAQMALLQERNVDDVTDKEFIAFFERFSHCFPTVPRIEAWRRYFPDSRIYFNFFDLLCESPLSAFAGVCEFIGVDHQKAPRESIANLAMPVNAGPRLPIPRRFAVHLAIRWHSQIEEICTRFRPNPQQWRNRCAAILGQATDPSVIARSV